MDTRFWDDRINPVLIKELRQAFHNRLMLYLSGILLVLQFAMLVIFHLTQKEWTDGGGVFVTIDAVLMNLCILIACAYGPLQRFTEERSSSELDFAAITLSVSEPGMSAQLTTMSTIGFPRNSFRQSEGRIMLT